MSRKPLFLIFSQTFVPDPASVGQHMADVAKEMARRGYRVVVYASSRGYDDPSQVYPAREERDGYEIRRIRFSSFGKQSIPRRVAGTASFITQVGVRGLTAALTGQAKGLLFSTSPPLVGFAGNLVRRLALGVPTTYWAMDLNPDQLIAMGKIEPGQRRARLLERVNLWILRRAALVVALDRFMAGRLEDRVDLDGRLHVAPPWPHETHVDPVAHDDNPFRTEHGLQGKFVVMYSGNHSPANPLDTVLAAALKLRDHDRIRFAFIGGGGEKAKVEAFVAEHGLSNCLCLPYQPMETLRFSLSAADVHVVTLGDNMVGIVHPCKVYGSMAVGRPILFCGPRPSHVTDLLDRADFGRSVRHGEADACVAAIEELAALPPATLETMGQTGQKLLASELSQEKLCGEMCDAIERTMKPRDPVATP